MTMPDSDSTVAQLVSQVLSKQGEQGERLARIDEKLGSLSDMPGRLREVELKLAEDKGGRDTWARIIAIFSLLITIAGVIAVIYSKGR